MATNQTPSSIAPGSLDAWEDLASYNDLRNFYGTDTAGAAQHYNTFGLAEGRAITFDAWVYMASNDDLFNYYGSSLDAIGAASHYVILGAAEGRATNTFDALAYINDAGNADLLAAFGGDADGGRSNGAQHYVTFGRSEIASGLRDSDGQAGTTFTLTAAADTVDGTPGDDTFVATDATLTAGDNLNGLGGYDTMLYSASATKNNAAFTMTNVERLQATADGASTSTFDMSGTTGVTTFASVNTTGHVDFEQVTGLAALEVRNMTTGGNVTLSYQDPVVAGGSDAMDLNLIGNVNTGIGTLLIGRTGDPNDGIETLNINTSQAATRIATLDTDVATLNVAGDQNLEIVNPLNPNISTVDASGLSANLDLNMTGQAVTQAFTGAQGDDTITWAGIASAVTANSGEGNDTLIMGNGGDVVDGGAGNDIISGNGGADTINGGDGNDIIDGGAGSNEITGGAGDDRITAGTGSDEIDGGDGNDIIDGSAGGNDEITGGAGDDWITAGGVADTINGGDGNDIIDGGAGGDSITGGAGDDQITAGDGADTILGGPGADVIDLTDTDSLVDTVRYNSTDDTGIAGVLEASQGDNVIAFATTEDVIDFSGDFLAGNMFGANANAVNGVAYAGGLDLDANGIGTDTVQLVGDGAATATLADLFVGNDLRTALGAVSNETVGDERIFIFNATSTDAAIYYFRSEVADDAITDNELSLLGVVDSTLVAGDITFT